MYNTYKLKLQKEETNLWPIFQTSSTIFQCYLHYRNHQTLANQLGLHRGRAETGSYLAGGSGGCCGLDDLTSGTENLDLLASRDAS